MSSGDEENMSPDRKKAKVLDDGGGIDDTHSISDNPNSKYVIPSTIDADAMEVEDFPELNTTDINKLLEAYRVNQSKAVKVEHHILFLEQSLKEFKIPKGLNWNKDYQVVDETEDFKAHIREIHMNAEIEIVNAIIDHYKDLYKILCKKSKAFVKKFEDLVPTTPELPEKAQACDKPIKALKEKLEQKRNKKLANIETHVTRGEKYVSKKKEPKQQCLNSRRQNNPQLPRQPP